MPKANIAIITGTRAEYGIWRPVLAAIQKSKKLNLQLIVTGMHLQTQFGYSINTIKDDRFPIAAKIPMYPARSSAFRRSSPAESLARGISGMAASFQKLKPDLVMVLGDRLEILAAANAALAQRIPLAHLHGGETAPGIWDEQIRHAVTKIAHLHFCATKTAANRIRQMGEDPATIHQVGAPALDNAQTAYHHFQTESREQGLPRGQFFIPLLVLHPSSADEKLEFARATKLIDAIYKRFPAPITTIGPNNDPGHRGILRAYAKRHNIIDLVSSVPQDEFWRLLFYHRLLLGNSSAGIIEAATFGAGVVNIGERQAGRERNRNVIELPWSADLETIFKTVHYAVADDGFRQTIAKRKNLYGDGHASQRILKILESLKFPLATTKHFQNF